MGGGGGHLGAAAKRWCRKNTTNTKCRERLTTATFLSTPINTTPHVQPNPATYRFVLELTTPPPGAPTPTPTTSSTSTPGVASLGRRGHGARGR